MIELEILGILGSIGLGFFLYFVIPKPMRMYLQYRLQGFKHDDIPKSLNEDWKSKRKWWKL